jgi:hypothetical protein
MFLLSKKPRVLAPLLLLSLVSLGSSILTFSKIDTVEMMISQAERQGQRTLSEEERATMTNTARVLTPLFIASASIGTVIFITLAALIYFGVFTVIGRQAGFKAFYAVTAFAFLPMIFRSLAVALQVSLAAPSSIVMEELGSLSLAVFLDPSSVSRLVYGLATMVDVVSIWSVILLIIGFKYLTPRSVGVPLRATGVLSVYLVFSTIGMLLQMLRPR